MAEANPVVVVHLAAALPALPLGAVVLARPKGTPLHKAMGRVWVGLMVVVVLTSLWIPSFLHFSWIHLFTALTTLGLTSALLHIRAGRISGHRKSMIGTYVGLCGAFVFALGPDRLIARTLAAWWGG